MVWYHKTDGVSDVRKNDAKSDWINALIHQATEKAFPSDEIVWLQEKFDSLGMKYGMERRQDIDRLVFQKMTGNCLVKDSQLLKIRYWRTGRHKPQSRQQCFEFGRALELDQNENCYLLQGYYDGADMIFGEADTQNPVYQSRMWVFRELERQYLVGVHPDTMEWFKIPWNNPEPFLRHYYFQDALQYISGMQQKENNSHFSSTNYVSEFQKSRRLLGEIPRRTILRHLFLMGAPFLSIDVMNERLTALGYTPLSEGHESRWGERIDLLMIGLIKHYEAECVGTSPELCMKWLRNTCQMLDERLVSSKHPELRFLNFKALKSSESKIQTVN